MERGETAVEIEIYEDGKGGWLLEVVDEFGNSTVWDDSFSTDSAALAEALKAIDTEGIMSLGWLDTRRHDTALTDRNLCGPAMLQLQEKTPCYRT